VRGLGRLGGWGALVAAGLACAGEGPPAAPADRPAQAPAEEHYRAERARLVEELRRLGIRDEAVLRAMGTVERHRFVPPRHRSEAYDNRPLPIGHEQTISQPYVVAFMTQAAGLRPTANVLEVGTGSGYQAAVLAEVLGLGPGSDPGAPRGRLCTIEIIPQLARRARATLEEVG
jgi:protein-L-isoaspartate(D-aspartate) O-methyltransferase